MRGNIRDTLIVVGVALTVAGCAAAPAPRTDLIRHYQCDDGTRVSVEIQPAVARVYTVTGVIELPRERGRDPAVYTNGLRSLAVHADGTVRHATGRRAWAGCEVI